jgi:hypothetical protein
VVSAISAALPVEKKLLKNYSEQSYEALAVLDKFFDAGHYVKNMTQHCPSKADFTA